jgi:hypothetical protein
MKDNAKDRSPSHLFSRQVVALWSYGKLKISVTQTFSFLQKEACLFTNALKQLPELWKRNI